MEQYLIIEKDKANFQKCLNQWRKEYKLFIIWMYFNEKTQIYHALIKREYKPKEVQEKQRRKEAKLEANIPSLEYTEDYLERD